MERLDLPKGFFHQPGESFVAGDSSSPSPRPVRFFGGARIVGAVVGRRARESVPWGRLDKGTGTTRDNRRC